MDKSVKEIYNLKQLIYYYIQNFFLLNSYKILNFFDNISPIKRTITSSFTFIT